MSGLDKNRAFGFRRRNDLHLRQELKFAEYPKASIL